MIKITIHKSIQYSLSSLLLIGILISNVSIQGDWVQDLIGNVTTASFPSDFETQAEENEIEEKTLHVVSFECLLGNKVINDDAFYKTCISSLQYSHPPDIPTPPPQVA